MGLSQRWLILLTFVGVCAALIGLRLLWRRWRQEIAKGWIIVPGEIETGSAEPFHDFCAVNLGYAYRVNERYYSGCYKAVVLDQDQAWFLINRAKGQKIFIRYKPGKPEVSRVRRDDNRHINLVAPGRVPVSVFR